MSDIIVLDVAPSAAIFNTTDPSLPQKLRDSGTNQPRFLLKYSKDEDQKAFWSWPLPSVNDVGALPGTAKLVLHWTANTVLTGNVQFGVQVGYVTEGEQIDKVLDAEVLSGVSAFSGVANQEERTTINLTALFAGLAVDKSARLTLSVRRNTAVASSLAQVVQLLKSQLLLDFTSKLEEEGPVFPTVVIDSTPFDLGLEHVGRHSMCDTTAAAAPINVFLPNENTLGVADDGKIFRISRKGGNLLTIAIKGGGSTTFRGTTTPTLFFTDGDCQDFMYVHVDNVYQVIG